jgi:hypothetical protein
MYYQYAFTFSGHYRTANLISEPQTKFIMHFCEEVCNNNRALQCHSLAYNKSFDEKRRSHYVN